MNKLVIVLATASIAVTASAERVLSDAPGYRAARCAVKTMQQSADNTVNTLVAKDDTSLEGLAGNYDWSFWNYQGAGSYYTEKMAITIDDAATGAVTVTLSDWNVKGVYDSTSCVLTIAANQYIETVTQTVGGEEKEIDIYLYHGVWNADGSNGGLVDEPFKLTFDGMALNFPTIVGTGDMAGETFGVDNVVIGNDAYGFYLYAGDNVVVKNFPYVEDMPEGEWISIGSGSFTDSWQMIAYVGADYADSQFVWDVEVQQNSLNPSLYRIHNPYNVPECLLYTYNFDMNGTGNIVFSVEDPDYVTVYPYIYSGMADDFGEYLNFNLEGYFTVFHGYDKERVIAEKVLTEGISHYADGRVTFLNCRFATTAAPSRVRSWTIGTGPSYLDITLPHAGVNIIKVDDNAPAEYYNLQGIKVAEPTAGIYIVRQGNRVTKRVVN